MTGRERGAATLLVLATTGVVLFVALALGGVAAIVLTHRQAQSAADLAALAGAGAAGRGEDPCAAAGTVAVANGGRLVGCTPAGGDVLVEVEVAGPRLAGRPYDVVAAARAGRR